MAQTKQLILKNAPFDQPKLGQETDSTWELRNIELPPLQDGQVLVKITYLVRYDRSGQSNRSDRLTLKLPVE